LATGCHHHHQRWRRIEELREDGLVLGLLLSGAVATRATREEGRGGAAREEKGGRGGWKEGGEREGRHIHSSNLWIK
jgi:hypothetical protein